MARSKGAASLREARLNRGLSLQALGEKLGVTGAAVGHYETGVSKPPADRAAKLARILGIEVGAIDVSQRQRRNRPKSTAGRRSAGRGTAGGGRGAAPNRDEASVLDALRGMPRGQRRVVVDLVLAYASAGSRGGSKR